jgi:hypothetical protein
MHTKALADLFVVVGQGFWALEPCAQRSEVLFQEKSVVVLLGEPGDVDVGVV